MGWEGEKWKGRTYMVSASRKETKSVGKNEEEAESVGGFSSGASVGIYFSVLKELAKAIFESLVLYFLRVRGGRERRSERTREGQRWVQSLPWKEEKLLIMMDQLF